MRTPRGGIDEPGFWPWHDVYANALVLVDRLATADEFLTPLEATAAQREHRSVSARLGYVRGRLLAARGDLAGAEEAFALARTRLVRLPLAYTRVRWNWTVLTDSIISAAKLGLRSRAELAARLSATEAR